MRIKSFNYIKYLCPCLFQIFEASVVHVFFLYMYMIAMSTGNVAAYMIKQNSVLSVSLLGQIINNK